VLIFALLVGVLGLLIGSFLNVVIWRLPRKESIVRPGSHCPSCNVQLAARDNVPVVSWLLLRARCRRCHVHISARYPLVEFGTGVLFAILAVRFGIAPELPAYLYLAAAGTALALIDFDTSRLPDSLTFSSAGACAALLVVATLAEGDTTALVRAGVGAAVLGGFYFWVWFLYPAGMGFGDVKLAQTIGAYLGWLSYGVLATGAFLGFFYGAFVGIGVIAFKGGGRKTKVPFGPSMLLGALTAILVGQELVTAYTSLLTR
jgi:leader peptidase (prepilin peptidase)/N-methyltransferase